MGGMWKFWSGLFFTCGCSTAFSVREDAVTSMEALFTQKMHTMSREANLFTQKTKQRWQNESVTRIRWDPTPMLTQVAETLQEGIAQHCGGWCITTLFTDFWR